MQDAPPAPDAPPRTGESFHLHGLHVDLHGPREETQAPPLLLIHGFMASRAQWHGNVERLSRRRRVAVVELLGHGRAHAPADPEAYTIPRYVETLEALRERLGVRRWHVCGQSLGAGISVAYVLAKPGAAIAQAFTNSGAVMTRPDDAAKVRERRATAAQIRAGGRAKLPEARVHPARATRYPPETKARLMADAALLDPEAMARAMEITVAGTAAMHRLHELRLPTLLINGRWEKRFQAHLPALRAGIPHLEVVDLEGGHSINAEQPEGFDNALEAFLDRHPGP
ncbi:alpha/beta fold hydrolase [Albimonas pacifica]|uniref:2-succinyl-6-hydroxy-2,4-cyclohexadiene-1-carboxylate synthase n=1 Tax=Albimonas pacifica TaxID=1114924 RepID=A0A1I3IEP5_9RHOB|nr:alpha/beta fold hydrolase [Albimonas pacifica]SFI46360.1 2-succinyl-6-hydroxy-2,4-cyclohexadiene-1-carboxylate synthase [Albimonas pacifica]